MITEDYVSYETAKLLKEKGFNENTYACFSNDGKETYYGYRAVGDDIMRPTLQMAMKWLREVYNIAISVYVFNRDLPIKENETRYTCTIATTEMSSREGHLRLVGTYEQVCEAAIKYCLEKLI